ncbi:MAG: histidine phosphatase family protein [Spirochaetaceae bacterium]|nr:MAG: histidine phosphatase family protein [Spirochaetaceae bacterium]
MLLYIIRHADPDYEAGTITEFGHKEASALAEIMPRLAPTHLYSSPLGRAKDTASYTVEATGLPLLIEDWTQEISGFAVDQGEPYGATAIWDYHGEDVRSVEPPGARTRDWLAAAPYNTDGFPELVGTLARNSDEFLARHGFDRDGGVYRIRDTAPGGGGGSVREQRLAVFCHGGFGLTWISHLLEIPLPLVYSGFYLWPSSVTTILFDERNGGTATPRCIGLGDVSHLHMAGLAPRPRGIKANYE